MFNFLKNLFSPKPSAVERMRKETMKTQTTVVANKQPFYHEMIGHFDYTYTVRVYNRNSGIMVEEKTCRDKEEALETALVLLAKYNKMGAQ